MGQRSLEAEVAPLTVHQEDAGADVFHQGVAGRLGWCIVVAFSEIFQGSFSGRTACGLLASAAF